MVSGKHEPHSGEGQVPELTNYPSPGLNIPVLPVLIVVYCLVGYDLNQLARLNLLPGLKNEFNQERPDDWLSVCYFCPELSAPVRAGHKTCLKIFKR